MKKNVFSRRAFVQKYVYAGAVVLGGVVIFGCNPSTNDEPPAHVPPTPEPARPVVDTAAKEKESVIADQQSVGTKKEATKDQVAKVTEKGKKSAAVNDCDDLSGVTPAELQKRKKLAYVDSSPIPDNTCSNCALHTPAKPGKNCGGCVLFKGPVRDEGYCAYWAPIIN